MHREVGFAHHIALLKGEQIMYYLLPIVLFIAAAHIVWIGTQADREEYLKYRAVQRIKLYYALRKVELYQQWVDHLLDSRPSN